MRLRKAATILAASLSLATTPVMAQSTATRASAQMVEPSLQEDEGSGGGINADWIVPGIIIIGIVITIFLIYTDEGDEVSP